MAAPKGNQFWKARTKHGRDKLFQSSDLLWEACCEYFQWVDENPLSEDNLVTFQGMATHEPIAKMRAMTIEGLCIFLGVNSKYFNDFESALDLNKDSDKDFSEVITRVKEIIKTQKFTGAAAGLLNPNIIARDLGLADKSDHTSSDGSMTPKPALDTSKLSTQSLTELMQARDSSTEPN